jgi:hypothetical protein
LSRVTGLVWLLVRFAGAAAVIVERNLRETGVDIHGMRA